MLLTKMYKPGFTDIVYNCKVCGAEFSCSAKQLKRSNSGLSIIPCPNCGVHCQPEGIGDIGEEEQPQSNDIKRA